MLVYILSVLILTAMLVAVIETRILRIKHYSLKAELPGKEGKQKRIALVSDLHCTGFGKNNDRLIKKISGLQPDFLIVAGDVINGRPEDIGYAREFFEGIKEAGIKAYYFYGNHEQKLSLISDDELVRYSDEISKYVTVINNDSVIVDELIELKGLLIPLKMYRDKFSNISAYFKAGEYVDKFNANDRYHILIAHDPTFAELYTELRPDLMIGGHLHGGIIRIPFVGGLISPRHRIFPKRTKGMYDIDGSKLLVTSGVGWHALPFRFCNDPEICLITINT
ncbi:MAG: metallophosphoesterase [Lachnospiraceae bacterium]|nr:metallophosphoesterase [Lachnospiraceae bacterium]